jgi:chromate transporter
MDRPPHPRLREAARCWLRVGLLGFGGPAGQIALLHRELVEKRRWIGESRFLHALNFCHLLPGPEAQQLATYCGWLLHGVRGGLVAGLLFFLPAALLLWGVSWAYVAWSGLPAVDALFAGVKPAVLALVAGAALRIGRKALRGPFLWVLAGAAFLALFAFQVPFPAVIALAGLAGWLGVRWNGPPLAREEGSTSGWAVIDEDTPDRVLPTWGRAVRVLATGLPLWWGPLLAAGLWLGWEHVLPQMGLFFAKAALVTFGGAYAVLPYVSQEAVETHGWLAPGQMLDGLAFAETNPGPLIMVLQFVGFLGGWRLPEPFSPLLAATLCAGVTTWTTFAPSFVWIFLGAPSVERLRSHAALTAALRGISAAVVGVILNLALWFGLHLVVPEGRPDFFAAGVALLALYLLQIRRWDVPRTLLVGALCGWARLGLLSLL